MMKKNIFLTLFTSVIFISWGYVWGLPTKLNFSCSKKWAQVASQKDTKIRTFIFEGEIEPLDAYLSKSEKYKPNEAQCILNYAKSVDLTVKTNISEFLRENANILSDKIKGGSEVLIATVFRNFKLISKKDTYEIANREISKKYLKKVLEEILKEKPITKRNEPQERGYEKVKRCNKAVIEEKFKIDKTLNRYLYTGNTEGVDNYLLKSHIYSGKEAYCIISYFKEQDIKLHQIIGKNMREQSDALKNEIKQGTKSIPKIIAKIFKQYKTQKGKYEIEKIEISEAYLKNILEDIVKEKSKEKRGEPQEDLSKKGKPQGKGYEKVAQCDKNMAAEKLKTDTALTQHFYNGDTEKVDSYLLKSRIYNAKEAYCIISYFKEQDIKLHQIIGKNMREQSDALKNEIKQGTKSIPKIIAKIFKQHKTQKGKYEIEKIEISEAYLKNILEDIVREKSKEKRGEPQEDLSKKGKPQGKGYEKVAQCSKSMAAEKLKTDKTLQQYVYNGNTEKVDKYLTDDKSIYSGKEAYCIFSYFKEIDVELRETIGKELRQQNEAKLVENIKKGQGVIIRTIFKKYKISERDGYVISKIEISPEYLDRLVAETLKSIKIGFIGPKIPLRTRTDSLIDNFLRSDSKIMRLVDNGRFEKMVIYISDNKYKNMLKLLEKIPNKIPFPPHLAGMLISRNVIFGKGNHPLLFFLSFPVYLDFLLIVPILIFFLLLLFNFFNVRNNLPVFSDWKFFLVFPIFTLFLILIVLIFNPAFTLASAVFTSFLTIFLFSAIFNLGFICSFFSSSSDIRSKLLKQIALRILVLLFYFISLVFLLSTGPKIVILIFVFAALVYHVLLKNTLGILDWRKFLKAIVVCSCFSLSLCLLLLFINRFYHLNQFYFQNLQYQDKKQVKINPIYKKTIENLYTVKPQNAITPLENIIAKNKNDVISHYILGNLYAHFGRPQDAVKECSTVINLSPSSVYSVVCKYRIKELLQQK